MMGTMRILRVDGTLTSEDFGRPLLHHELQNAVGGAIEIVGGLNEFFGTPCVAFCNEEGKLRRLPENLVASVMWDMQVRKGDISGPDDYGEILHGDIVTGDRDFMEAL